MSHPLVEFLLARYDEEDPDHTDPDVNERREQATTTECHLITGDEPYDNYRSVRAVAWLALRVAGARYHTHPDYLDEWLPPILSGRPDEEPTT